MPLELSTLTVNCVRCDPKGWCARLFDDPNHRHYGAARRLHIILMQITENYESIDRLFALDSSETWDVLLDYHLCRGDSEALAQRRVISEWLHYVSW